VRILVVDDEVALAKMLALTLKTLGHEAIVSYHPEDALRCLNQRIDAVISDLNMPVMDGVEMARRIREVLPDIPIAFCTGSDPDDSLTRSASAIGTVMPKLYTIAQLKETLESFRTAIASVSFLH
jgi:two-component system OmpR family response regulator